MLDVNQIGKTIADLRKSKNMTQAALAEKLFVSYQAVSSWERGLTLPDIDKLKDLSEIFGCSIEDMIGADGRAAEDIVNGKTPPLDNISCVAQIIEPKKLDELVNTAIQADSKRQPIPYAVKDIVPLAPFISCELLDKLLDGSDSLDIEDVIALLPFLSKDKLNEIAEKTVVDDPQKLVIIAPFLEKSKLDALVDKIDAVKLKDIVPLAPFLSRDKLVELATKIKDVAPDVLTMLAPFLVGDK